jgi:hypothetical protein
MYTQYDSPCSLILEKQINNILAQIIFSKKNLAKHNWDVTFIQPHQNTTVLPLPPLRSLFHTQRYIHARPSRNPKVDSKSSQLACTGTAGIAMVKVKPQSGLLESSMDCFYPFISCASAIDSYVYNGGGTPRDKTIKNIGSSSGNKMGRNSRDQLEPKKSISISIEKLMTKESFNKRKDGRILKKRLGAAYMRSSESVATKETTFVAERGLNEAAHQSEDTYVIESTSGSYSSRGISSSSDSTESIEGVGEALTARPRDFLVENRSISTEDVEKKTVNNAFSWFLVPTIEVKTPAPTSPTDSVGAVKTSFRSKFDYIRKNQRFANPFPDPPSDRSMITTKSIIAAEAGSLLKKGYRTSIHKKTVMVARRNELVKQILKQRPTVSRPGFDP